MVVKISKKVPEVKFCHYLHFSIPGVVEKAFFFNSPPPPHGYSYSCFFDSYPVSGQYLMCPPKRIEIRGVGLTRQWKKRNGSESVHIVQIPVSHSNYKPISKIDKKAWIGVTTTILTFDLHFFLEKTCLCIRLAGAWLKCTFFFFLGVVGSLLCQKLWNLPVLSAPQCQIDT